MRIALDTNLTPIERLLSPLRRLANVSSAGGIVLLAAAIVALVWANSHWAASYHQVWETSITLRLGSWSASGSAQHLINDGLMVIFFFLVGLEIKREVVAGELKNARTATLPMIAALGGMIVPALIYILINAGGEGARGWGVPMATDIAFALGVLSLLGNRVPSVLKVFVAAFAIADDIGAIFVIAIFYSVGINWIALGMAVAILLISAGANAAGVRNPWAFAVIGLLLWIAVLSSGIHATVAGVLLAMTIPVRTRIAEDTFLLNAQRTLDAFHRAAEQTADDDNLTVLTNADHHTALEELETLVDAARPPLIRMERALHGVVAFAILPLFALANAGVTLTAGSTTSALSNAITLGVLIGLAAGKPIGITLFSWMAVRTRVATLPQGVTWRMLIGASVLGGIGFTMALFIAGLAFPSNATLDDAKIGVLSASLLTGVAGWLWMRFALRDRSS